MLFRAFNRFAGLFGTRSPRVYCRSLRLLHDAYRSRAAGSVLWEGLRVLCYGKDCAFAGDVTGSIGAAVLS